MKGFMTTTASNLRAIMCYIAPNGKPEFTYDDEALAKPLYKKLSEALLANTGSLPVSIHFDGSKKDAELYRQFKGCCHNIMKVFDGMVYEDDLVLIGKK